MGKPDFRAEGERTHLKTYAENKISSRNGGDFPAGKESKNDNNSIDCIDYYVHSRKVGKQNEEAFLCRV